MSTHTHTHTHTYTHIYTHTDLAALDRELSSSGADVSKILAEVEGDAEASTDAQDDDEIAIFGAN